MGTSRPVLPEPVAVGLGTALLLGLVLGGLSLAGVLDPVQLLLPGQRGAGGDVMVDDFGLDRIPDGFSYDGQQYYLAARYFPDLEAAGQVMGGPRFRLVRIGLPALAAVGGGGMPLVVLLVAINVLGVGLAAGAVTDLARRHGRRGPVGAAAAAGLLLPLLLTTAECLAFGLGFLALALVDRGWVGVPIATLAAAGLTRETALTFGLGVLALWLSQRRFRAVAALPVAVLPLLLWRLHVQELFPDGDDAPLAFLDLLRLGDRPVADQVVAIVVVALGVWATVRWRDVLLVWPLAVASVAWILVFEYDTFDWRALPRVSAPAVVLGLAAMASVVSSRRSLSPEHSVEADAEHF